MIDSLHLRAVAGSVRRMSFRLGKPLLRALVAATGAAAAAAAPSVADKSRLPLPDPLLPPLPALRPGVVTGSGRRLLLADTDVRMAWDPERRRLSCNKPGWWIVNYPLYRIRGLAGLTPEQRFETVLGLPAARVKNWYFCLPGPSAPEPGPPAGPARIAISAQPTFVVGPPEGPAPRAGAGRPSSVRGRFTTIQAALERAGPGDVVQVLPGVYREGIRFVRGGLRGKPVVLEGVRDRQGRMPVISGNDPFPAGAWSAVHGAPGVFRAALFTGRMGAVAMGGQVLTERSWYGELGPGETCFNWGSREANRFRVPPDAAPRAGDELSGRRWRFAPVDDDGFLDLAKLPEGAAPAAVYYAFAYVWVDPGETKETWDPRFPEPITGRVVMPGDFRAGRQTGSELKSQLNFCRVWCNGHRVPSVVRMTPDTVPIPPRPTRNYSRNGDRIEDFAMARGWNRLLFQLDTTRHPKRVRFKFLAPKGVKKFVTAVRPPGSAAEKPQAPAAPHITGYLVLGPFRSEPDTAVYVRLPDDRDPNTAAMSLAARGSTVVRCEYDYVHIRGFEIFGGGQFQQQPLVRVAGAGCLIEGCLIRDSEVTGLAISNPRDQRADPLVVRNNWIVDPGGAGITAQHSSTELTAENQTRIAPGRGPLLIEYNVIRGANWAGHPVFWESGGMKLFRLTGSVVRYNDISDGFGPGIWLDWEHYNNRIEGNLIHRNWSFGIGIEASPGPNLVANNLIVDMRPGRVWFRWNILDWSSGRTLAIHNTIDGKWRPEPCWFNRRGTDGIFLGHEGSADRRTRWQPLPEDRHAAAVNNLIVGCARALHPKHPTTCTANYTDRGRDAAPSPTPPAFRRAGPFDYRLAPGHPLGRCGVADGPAALVRHDFFGLPRAAGRRAVGAFRVGPTHRSGDGPVIQIELADGAVVTRP
ncbi:MAG: hypothetical protein GXP31_18960 [Kiritimatiellaeota bacterium]|nr:hypothetical protein [Kiritimatiellota bacterium]